MEIILIDNIVNPPYNELVKDWNIWSVKMRNSVNRGFTEYWIIIIYGRFAKKIIQKTS